MECLAAYHNERSEQFRNTMETLWETPVGRSVRCTVCGRVFIDTYARPRPATLQARKEPCGCSSLSTQNLMG